MPRYLVHHDGQFLEWSTIVDAPVTFGMSAAEMVEWLTTRYGDEGAANAPARIGRALINGTSWMMGPMSAADCFSGNRAGPNETCLTDEQIIRLYFVEKREPDPARPEDQGVDLIEQ